jgi:hypothetical protein
LHTQWRCNVNSVPPVLLSRHPTSMISVSLVWSARIGRWLSVEWPYLLFWDEVLWRPGSLNFNGDLPSRFRLSSYTTMWSLASQYAIQTADGERWPKRRVSAMVGSIPYVLYINDCWWYTSATVWLSEAYLICVNIYSSHMQLIKLVTFVTLDYRRIFPCARRSGSNAVIIWFLNIVLPLKFWFSRRNSKTSAAILINQVILAI